MKLKYIEDFHGERQNAIGSSDVSTIAGLNVKYGQTPIKLWEEKKGISEQFQGNEATYWGHRHELNILHRYIKNLTNEEIADKWLVKRLTGKNKFKADGYEFYSNTKAEYEGFWKIKNIAHADLFVKMPENKYHIQEAKSLRLYSSKRDENNEYGYSSSDTSLNGLPLSVYLQTQFQLLVYRKCYGIQTKDISLGVSCLIDTSDYREYTNKKEWYDEVTIESINEMVNRFKSYITENIPPQPLTWEDVQRLYPKTIQNAVVLPKSYSIKNDISLENMLNRREHLQKQSSEIEKELDEIQNAIGILMGENSRIQTPEGDILVTCSESERKSISLKTLEENEPEIYRQVVEKNLVNVSKFKRLYYRKVK